VAILTKKSGKTRNEIYGKNAAGTVFAVQYALEKFGYPVGNIDGQNGPKTEAAVKRFQYYWNLANSDDKIAEDGFAGGETIKRILLKMKKNFSFS
jgi:peptidoglycan hydrolase-like protein with peptidoglycan-binding domain